MQLGEVYVDVALNEDSVTTLEETIKKRLERNFNTKVNIDDSALTNLNKHIDKKIKHLKELSNTVASPKIDSKSLDSFNKKLDNVIEKLNKLGNNGVKIDAEVRVKEDSGFGQKGIEDLLKKQLGSLTNVRLGFFQSLGAEFGKAISKGISEAISEEIGSSLDSLAKMGTKWLINYLKDLGKTAPSVSVPLKLVPGNQAIVPPVRQTQPVSVSNYKNQAANTNISSGSGLSQRVTSSFGNLSGLAGNTGDIEKAKIQFTKIRNSFGVAYKVYQREIEKGNFELAKAYADTIITNAKRASEDINKLKADLVSRGVKGSFGSELATMAGSAKGVITSRYVNPTKRSFGLAEQSATSAKANADIATNILGGIKEGLGSGSKSVIQSTGLVADLMVKAFRDKLGIKSPSQVFKNLMGYVGQGISVGLDAVKNIAQKSASAVADTIINPVSQKLGNFKNSVKSAVAPQGDPAKFGTEAYFSKGIDTLVNRLISAVQKNSGMSRQQSSDVLKEAGGFAFAEMALLAPLQTTVATALAPLATAIAPTTLAILSIKDSIILPLWRTVTGFIQATQPLLTSIKYISGGDTGRSQQTREYLTGASGKFGTPLESGAKAFVSLTTAAEGTKVEGQNVKNLFEGISASTKALGLNTYDSSLIFQAYTQILSKGKVSMEELRQQLGEKFPPALNIFAKALGVSNSEVTELSAKGALLSDTVLPKVAKVLLAEYSQFAGQTDNFITALNKFNNALFEGQIKIGEYFDGAFSQITGVGTKIVGIFNENFGVISKALTFIFIGLSAQVAVGFQAIFAIPFVASKMAVVQGAILASFRGLLKTTAPLMFGILADFIDDFFGTQNSALDNISNGLNNLFTGITSAIANATKNSQGLSLGFDTKETEAGLGGIISKVKEFASVIPKGVVEFGALYILLESFMVLSKMYVLPTLVAIGQSVLGVGRAFASAALSAQTWRDAFRAITADSSMAKAGMLALNIGLKAFSTLALLAFAQSDFTDPLNKSINEAKNNIKNGVADLREVLANLRDDASKTGEAIKTITIASKGLELNIPKIIGLSDTSFKSDDLLNELNKASTGVKTFLNLFDRLNAAVYKSMTGIELPSWMRGLSSLKTSESQISEAESLGLGDIINTSDTYLTLGKQQLLNSARDLKSLETGVSQALDELGLSAEKQGTFISGKVAATVKTLEAYDQQLLSLGARRRDAALKGDTAANIEIREIDKEIIAVNKKRQLDAKPLEVLTLTVRDWVKIIEAKQKEIENISDVKSRNALKNLIDPQVRMIKETEQFLSQSRIGQLVQPLEDVWAKVTVRISDAELAFTRLQRTTRLYGLRGQTSIASSATSKTSDAQLKVAQDSLSLTTLTQTENQLKTILQERTVALNKLLAIGGYDINSTRKEETEKIRTQINESLVQLEETRLQIAQQRQQLVARLRDTNKQIEEYYKQVIKDTETLNTELATTQNNISLNKQKNRLKQALLGFQDTFVTGYVDGIVGMLDTINQPMQQYLQNIATINNARNAGNEQLKRSAEQLDQLNNLRGGVGNFNQIGITGGSGGYSRGVVSPLSGNAPITSGFGNRVIFGKPQHHNGIDFGVPVGTSVRSTTAGKVSSVFNDAGGGLTVTVASIDQAGRKIEQSYLHLSKALVNINDVVSQGQQIALSGNSGARTTGAHLDWRIKINGSYINPRDFLKLSNLIIGNPTQTQGQTESNKPTQQTSLFKSGVGTKINPTPMPGLKKGQLNETRTPTTGKLTTDPSNWDSFPFPGRAKSQSLNKQLKATFGVGGNNEDQSGDVNAGDWRITKASMYGNRDGFHGKPTASGETFNTNAMTAASPTLPMGTVLEIMNPMTNQRATIRINDRGPFANVQGKPIYRNGKLIPHPTRGLDLSVAAARAVGISEKQGIGDVMYRVVSIQNRTNQRPKKSAQQIQDEKDWEAGIPNATTTEYENQQRQANRPFADKLRDLNPVNLFKKVQESIPNINPQSFIDKLFGRKSSPAATATVPQNQGVVDSSGSIEFSAPPVPQISEEEYNSALRKLQESEALIKENYTKQIENANSLLTSQEESAQLELQLQSQKARRLLQQGLRENEQQVTTERRGIEDIQIDPNSNKWVDRYVREQTQIERKYEDNTQRLRENLEKTLSAKDQLSALLTLIQGGGLAQQEVFNQQIPDITQSITQLTKQSESYTAFLNEQAKLKDLELKRLDAVFAREKEQTELSDISRLLKDRIDSYTTSADLAEKNQRNKFDLAFGDPLGLRFEAKKLENELATTEAIQQLKTFAEATRLTDTDLMNLTNSIKSMGQASELAAQTEYERAIQQRDLEKKRFDLDFKGRKVGSLGALDSAQTEYFNLRGLSGRDYDYSRQVREQGLTFEQSLQDLEEFRISTGKTTEEIAHLKTELEQLNQLKLDNIKTQFDPWNDVAKSAVDGLQTSIAGLISGTMGLGDAFTNIGASIADTLTKLAAEWVTNELVRSIFGVGLGSKTVMSASSSAPASKPFGFIGELLGGVLGFKTGGDVIGMNFSELRKSDHSIGRALRKEGANSVLAALTPGERVLTVQENMKYKQLLAKGVDILNFSKGGDVAMNIPKINFPSQGGGQVNNISIDAKVGETPNLDESRLIKAVRTVVVAEMKRQQNKR